MYPLDQGMWGPIVRITNLRAELAQRVNLDVLSGYRGARRVALARYAVSGRLRGLDGIYVESSTFLPAEADLAFLALARALGVPVLTYIRDAYQLFPEYYLATTLRRRLAAKVFRPAIRALGSVSTQLAFPSRGLSRVVTGREDGGLVIPPGSPAPVRVPKAPNARRLLFVGNGTLEAQGARRLMTAVAMARAAGTDVELTIVSRPGEEPPPPRERHVDIVHAEGHGITALLPDVVATVIPRPRSEYNDLAVPIKLFDYLAWGRPLIVTDCVEQAAIVSSAGAGLVVSQAESAIAGGIMRMVEADQVQHRRWSEHATAAALAHSWSSRAEVIISTLGVS